MFHDTFTWFSQKFKLRKKRETSSPETSTTKRTLYDCIIVGAGTGGCITAYELAKKMDAKLPTGRVLLIDSGDHYVQSVSSKQSPSPDLWDWYTNWSEFTVVHETVAPDFIPAVASTHIGVGGAGTHDTRITYIPPKRQQIRYAKSLNQTTILFENYIQTTLDMIPLVSAGCGERFYDNVISKLNESNVLDAIPDLKAEIVDNSVGYVSIAMYPDRTRWTSAYLLDPTLKPKSLDVLVNTPIDKVLFETPESFQGTLSTTVATAVGVKTASGVDVYCKQGGEIIIAAGSLGTPAILQRSGIGPRKILEELKIPVIHANDEVGHGVDHIEVPVMYRWLDTWNEPNGLPPPGGPMAWPLAMFFNDENMVHFGISPPPYGGNEVTGTPNCMHPDPKYGFYAEIQTKDPLEPIHVRHVAAPNDFKVLASGVRKMVNVFENMKTLGLVGERETPPLSLDIYDDDALDSWIRNHTGTAYHWMSTCKSGVEGSVANHNFLVNGVDNLRVGSGAALPEIPEANPHFTISVFSRILADYTFQDLYAKRLIDTVIHLPPFRRDLSDQTPGALRTMSSTPSEVMLSTPSEVTSWCIKTPTEEIPFMGNIMESHVGSRVKTQQ